MVIIGISERKSLSLSPEIIQKATEFINRHIINTLDIFSQIIGTYALGKSGSSLVSGKIST